MLFVISSRDIARRNGTLPSGISADGSTFVAPESERFGISAGRSPFPTFNAPVSGGGFNVAAALNGILPTGWQVDPTVRRATLLDPGNLISETIRGITGTTGTNRDGSPMAGALSNEAQALLSGANSVTNNTSVRGIQAKSNSKNQNAWAELMSKVNGIDGSQNQVEYLVAVSELAKRSGVIIDPQLVGRAREAVNLTVTEERRRGIMSANGSYSNTGFGQPSTAERIMNGVGVGLQTAAMMSQQMNNPYGGFNGGYGSGYPTNNGGYGGFGTPSFINNFQQPQQQQQKPSGWATFASTVGGFLRGFSA
jgi:hypothetical protein